MPDEQRSGAASHGRALHGLGFLRNALIDSMTVAFAVVFAFQLSGLVPSLAVVGASYVLAIPLGAAARWGIAVYLFHPDRSLAILNLLPGTCHEKAPLSPRA